MENFVFSQKSVLEVWLDFEYNPVLHQMLLQPTITCLKLTIKPLEQSVKYVQI